MKFKIGDKVVFIHNTNIAYAWKLCDYSTYIISDYAIDNYSTIHYSVDNLNNNTYSSWYNEKDFVTLKEYRKLKLNKLLYVSKFNK